MIRPEDIKLQKIGIKGWLELRVVDKNGKKELVNIVPFPNIIVDVALAEMANHVIAAAALHWTHGAVGTGTNVEAEANTVLQTEVSRNAWDTADRLQTAVANDTARLISTSDAAPGGGWEITEFAAFTGAAGGTMYCRCVFAAVTVPEGNKIEVTYKSQMQRVP